MPRLPRRRSRPSHELPGSSAGRQLITTQEGGRPLGGSVGLSPSPRPGNERSNASSTTHTKAGALVLAAVEEARRATQGSPRSLRSRSRAVTSGRGRHSGGDAPSRLTARRGGGQRSGVPRLPTGDVSLAPFPCPVRLGGVSGPRGARNNLAAVGKRRPKAGTDLPAISGLDRGRTFHTVATFRSPTPSTATNPECHPSFPLVRSGFSR